MLYATGRDLTDAPRKKLMFFGMSGLGKTHLAKALRAGGWFHYSVDYRIGTRYMGELIADNAKTHAMQVPFLRDLLMTDSIYIGSNITFDNLAPVSSYLGKPGDVGRGGLPIGEYRRRQGQFARGEIAALMDSAHFIERACSLYGYDHFVCDTGGSICEWVDPDDPADPIMTELSAHLLPVWLKGTEAHTEALIRRFDRAPKPMSYQPAFLDACWEDYRAETEDSAEAVDPDAFVRWTYARALAHRQPRYAAMAARWGVTVPAEEMAGLTSPEEIVAAVARALDR